jgi:hypothetical protein
MVECKLCNKQFARIHPSHLKYKHNISYKEYKRLYPNAELISEESTLKTSTTVKKAHFETYGCNPSSLPEKKEKRKNTMLRVHGVENAMQNEALKNKCVEHRQNTLEETYGVINPVYIPGVTQKLQETYKDTCLKKYGVTHYMKVKEYSQKQAKKRDETLFERYNETNPMQVEEFARKNREKQKEHLNPTYPEQKIIDLNMEDLQFTGFGEVWVTLNIEGKKRTKILIL